MSQNVTQSILNEKKVELLNGIFGCNIILTTHIDISGLAAAYKTYPEVFKIEDIREVDIIMEWCNIETLTELITLMKKIVDICEKVQGVTVTTGSKLESRRIEDSIHWSKKEQKFSKIDSLRAAIKIAGKKFNLLTINFHTSNEKSVCNSSKQLAQRFHFHDVHEIIEFYSVLIQGTLEYISLSMAVSGGYTKVQTDNIESTIDKMNLLVSKIYSEKCDANEHISLIKLSREIEQAVGKGGTEVYDVRNIAKELGDASKRIRGRDDMTLERIADKISKMRDTLVLRGVDKMRHIRYVHDTERMLEGEFDSTVLRSIVRVYANKINEALT